jgi:predicted nuclease of predicted toxin-antitoxin system
MRLLLDENFNHRILNGLKLRVPRLDYVIAQRSDLTGVRDPVLLEWAASADRILLTHDIETMPNFVNERIAAGLPMPGVIVIPQLLPIGQAIEELVIIIECSDQVEYENQITYLPL